MGIPGENVGGITNTTNTFTVTTDGGITVHREDVTDASEDPGGDRILANVPGFGPVTTGMVESVSHVVDAVVEHWRGVRSRPVASAPAPARTVPPSAGAVDGFRSECAVVDDGCAGSFDLVEAVS